MSKGKRPLRTIIGGFTITDHITPVVNAKSCSTGVAIPRTEPSKPEESLRAFARRLEEVARLRPWETQSQAPRSRVEANA